MAQYKKLTNESKNKFSQIIEESLMDDRMVKIYDNGKRELYWNLPMIIELKTI